MKNIHSVIGLGYGDEGKGVATDFLCSQYDSDDVYVIRHSGGHQVGHTVKIGDIIHNLHHFGAGTLRGIPTIWSKRCTISPIHFRQERDVLLMKGIVPKFYSYPFNRITTPYDIAYNRAVCRSININDSVGVGFAATLKRHELVPLYSIDLTFRYVLNTKLGNIKDHYTKLVSINPLLSKYYEEELSKLNSENKNFTFEEDCQLFVDSNTLISDGFNPFTKNVVFEGNQGVLLDKDHGFYPYVTYGNTTNKTLADWNIDDRKVDCWYISRGYSTRHGDGPLHKNDTEIVLKNNENESNHFNTHQGHFRVSPLNIDLLEYAFLIDNLYLKNNQSKNLLITCLDQIDCENSPFIKDDQLVYGNLLKGIRSSKIRAKLHINTSAESKTIEAIR